MYPSSMITLNNSENGRQKTTPGQAELMPLLIGLFYTQILINVVTNVSCLDIRWQDFLTTL